MKIRDYKELNVWKKGIEIVDGIYLITKLFPKDELYGLTSQLRKAAVSVPSNIAEGFGRHYTKEYKRFLYIASGSCAELDTQLIIACRRQFAPISELERLLEMVNHESRMLLSLIHRL